MNPTEKTEKTEKIEKKEIKNAPELAAPVTTVVLDQENAYLSDVIKAQPKTLSEIEVRLKEEIDPTQHQLSLPPEIKAYEKKYAFRWIMHNRKSISLASQVRRLMFVNKTHFPDLPDHLFSASGAVERGDSILVFTLREISEQRRKQAADLSRDRVKSKLGAHKGNPNFYVPTDAEDGITKVVGL